MRLSAVGLALGLVAASCGGATGEAPIAASPEPTVAPAVLTQAPVAAPKPTFLMLYGDTVRGTAGLSPEEKDSSKPAGLTCVQMSRFPIGSRIVWRMRVIDPLTNTAMSDKVLEYVKLKLPDGKEQVLKYGGHGGTKENPADFFWVTGWTVPADYPTGVFNYLVEAKSLVGAIGTFGYDAFKVPSGQLQIIPADLGKRIF
jgi:hypothetical protein